MDCVLGCGACCIAPSISSLNKAAGVRCKHLSSENLCLIFDKPERPAVCSQFKACDWICGDGPKQALKTLERLEIETI
ncbi:YkgJ family cysteine cluster protein [Alginatibacterium sediminis]|uniref:YkgJ family cysteine cluster protein n=1 Tax=Alginatibacterium sediminis TaxID=2164068 RepID=A0A420ELH3_9ALTE|nr:YkgJ family cysteine cluster protein [Alginatibacterium sediminis]RKF21490.1 YkgJ family cysteine cluster protein [Alginatibacterium sediminis]